MSDRGSVAQWLLRVTKPPTARAGCSGPAGARQSAVLFFPGAWHLWDTPDQAPVSARGIPDQSPPHWAHPGPGRTPLQNAAQIQSADDGWPSPDGGTEPAQSGVYGACT